LEVFLDGFNVELPSVAALVLLVTVVMPRVRGISWPLALIVGRQLRTYKRVTEYTFEDMIEQHSKANEGLGSLLWKRAAYRIKTNTALVVVRENVPTNI